MRTFASVLVLALVAATGVSAQARKAAPAAAPSAIPDADFRAVDPENALLIETSKGRVVVELSPTAAPGHVERMKKLAREKFYDGHRFHRVVDWFMAQTGDPLGTGEGQSPYEDLAGEFTFRRTGDMAFTPIAQPNGARVGFLGSFPIQTQPDDLMALTQDGKVAAWGLYCPGVAGMARGAPENSANSQFFLMRQTYPSLEKRYTAWGRVVHGLDVVRALKHGPDGQPIENPDVMKSVRVLADVPPAERPTVRVLDTKSKSFGTIVEAARAAKGADFSVCDVELPSKIG